MGSSYAQMIALLLPQLPLIGKTSVLHALNLTAQAKYMDLQSELAVSVLRALCVPSDKRGVAEVQRYTLRDPGIKGRIWVSKYACPKPPETSIKEALLAAIENLKDSECASQVTLPDIVPVEAEWTGYRAGASTDSRLPAVSDKELYDRLQKECSSPATTLYFHGGAYYLMDPSSHRATTKKLAKLSGGKVYSVRYRLAPQNPFPAALLDALMSYFALLYPPPGSYHDAIEPEHIVLAGDSAGGNLALALLQTLLQLRRQAAKVTWFGSEREVPLPAGVAVSSPWLDMTQSFPSWETNWKFDYLPRPSEVKKTEVPPDHIWPAKPPRKHMYVDDAFLMHPLASLVVNQSWESSPPIWMCVGWEMLADEIKFLAKKLSEDGVLVVFEEFEAMPHCFSLILGSLPGTRKCFDDWAGFIKAAAENPGEIGSRAFAIKAKSLEEANLKFEDLSSTSLDAVRQGIRKRIESSSFSDTTASKL